MRPETRRARREIRFTTINAADLRVPRSALTGHAHRSSHFASWLGIVVRWEPAPFNNGIVGIALATLGILAGWFFHSAARDSHAVLCKTRSEINTRLDAYERSKLPTLAT
jgi:hypothetical protein